VAALVAAGAGLLGLAGCVKAPGDAGPADVQLQVDLGNGATHAISPLIYGTNGARGIAANHQTLVRLGGNRWTAWNWENNASNAGSDWCFQNDGLLSSSNSPAAAVTPAIDEAAAAGAATLVTVPIVDYVAADKNGGCDVRNSGADYLTTRFRQNLPARNGPFAPAPDAGDRFVYQDEFVSWLKANRPAAPILFSLDNEPDLWSSTHAEVHPGAVSYAELVRRNVDYATAIKRVWPAATVTGPVNYGYNGFQTLQNAPDAAGRNFVETYLDQVHAAEAAAGHRLIDVLDVHWYPEAQGAGVRITAPDAADAVVAARVQAPRSLWDPAYRETSWITQNDGPIALIPRMRARIAQRNPGMGLAFTEWNYGGGGHISGAVATADVLGVFGREDVRLANLWELNGDEAFTYAAFRAFRNYDGRGGTFGDTSRGATTSDAAAVSVYASTFARIPDRPVIVAVNKATTARTAGLSLTTLGTVYPRADVYTVTAAGGPGVVAQPAITAVATNAFRPTLPPLSVTVVVPRT
jgi:hypothetical protein